MNITCQLNGSLLGTAAATRRRFTNRSLVCVHWLDGCLTSIACGQHDKGLHAFTIIIAPLQCEGISASEAADAAPGSGPAATGRTGRRTGASRAAWPAPAARLAALLRGPQAPLDGLLAAGHSVGHENCNCMLEPASSMCPKDWVLQGPEGATLPVVHHSRTCLLRSSQAAWGLQQATQEADATADCAYKRQPG